MDRKQKLPSAITCAEFVERPPVTGQLVGGGQDLVRLTHLAIFATVGVPMLFRLDGVNVVVRHIGEDADEPLRGAPMALFDTNQRHVAVVSCRFHEGVVAHDGGGVSRPKGRRAEAGPPDGRRPHPF